MSNRRKFLKSAGSTALFTSLGSSFFIGCSTSEEVIQPDNNNNNNNNVSPDDGYSVDGGNYIIELNHSNFSILIICDSTFFESGICFHSNSGFPIFTKQVLFSIQQSKLPEIVFILIFLVFILFIK